MKKIIFCAMALIGLNTVNAQSNQIKFGVKAGFIHSTITGDYYYDGHHLHHNDYDSKIGGYIGGLVDIPVQGNFHIQPELLFTSEGSDDLGMVYARIPVLGKYYLMEGFAVQAGPLFGIRLSAQNHFDDVTKPIDFGLSGGATYEWPFGLFVDARFNAGILNISEVNKKDFRTASFQVGAGYRF